MASASGETQSQAGHSNISTSENTLEVVVANYMKRKGYTGSLKSFMQETGIADDQIAVTQDLISEFNILQSIFTYSNAERFAGTFEQNYAMLVEFVESALESFKPELSSVLYPLFVHGYLNFIKHGQQIYATRFWQKYIGNVDPQNHTEANQLMSIITPEQMKENELAQLWEQNKYKLSMSTFSHEMLMTFLQEQQLVKIMTMINEHIDIKTFAGFPQTHVESCTLLDPESQSQLNADKESKKVYLSIFSDLRKWYDKSEDLMEVEPTETAAQPGDSHSTSAQKENPKKRKRKGEEDPPTDTRVPLQISVGPEYEKTHLQDIKTRLNLSDKSLPDVCFFTIFNTHGEMTCSKVSRDANFFAAGFGDSTVKMWDVHGDRSNNPSIWMKAQSDFMNSDSRDDRYKIKPQSYNELIGHSQSVMSLDFAPDSSHLLSSSSDGTVRLWSMETMTNLVCYRGHNFPVWQVKFAPLGYYFATASYDRTARLWVTSSVHAVRIFAGHLNDVNTISFHPNYYYLFTGSADKTLRLWEVHTGNSVRIFAGHNAAVNDCVVSPDGRTAVSTGDDGLVIVWDLASGTRITSLEGHSAPVYSVDVSGEGHILASGGNDGTVRLWDLRMISDAAFDSSSSGSAPVFEQSKASKALLSTFHTKSTPVTHVGFTRSNLLLASGPFRPPIAED